MSELNDKLSVTEHLPTSIQERPSVCSVKPAYLNRFLKARVKVVQIHAVLGAGFRNQWFPMRNTPTTCTSHRAERLVAPDVLGRALGMPFDLHGPELVVSP